MNVIIIESGRARKTALVLKRAIINTTLALTHEFYQVEETINNARNELHKLKGELEDMHEPVDLDPRPHYRRLENKRW